MSAERKLMLGSEGKLDYLQVATRGHLAMGVKAFTAGAHPYGLMWGMRVRVARAPSCPQSEKYKPVDWKAEWPEVDWKTVGDARASAMLVLPSGLFPIDTDHLKEQVAAAAWRLVKKLHEAIPLDDPDDAQLFMQEAFSAQVEALQVAMPALSGGLAQNPDVEPDYAHAMLPEVKDTQNLSTDASPAQMIGDVAKAVKHNFKVIEGGKAGNPDADFAPSEEADTTTVED